MTDLRWACSDFSGPETVPWSCYHKEALKGKREKRKVVVVSLRAIVVTAVHCWIALQEAYSSGKWTQA